MYEYALCPSFCRIRRRREGIFTVRESNNSQVECRPVSEIGRETLAPNARFSFQFPSEWARVGLQLS